MIEPEPIQFDDDGAVPNSRLPLLVYRKAVPEDAEAIESLFAANRWPPAWRDGVHPFQHFHSAAHEVLGVARGEVTVLFGGPGGRALKLGAGDVAVLPAGVGHCNQSQSHDLLIVGAYPDDTGRRVDTRRGSPAEIDEVRGNITTVATPTADPVTGMDGALGRLWGK
jgi:uncharacterized protein YjlB